MKHYYAYIDEAGDEGFGKLKAGEERRGQSTWFLIGSIIVGEANNLKLPAWKRELREKFPEKKKLDLHWRNLNHEQRKVVCANMASWPIGAALALSHKVTIPGSEYEEAFKNPQYLYNYLVRFLLERQIDACKVKAAQQRDQARLHLTFSRRSGTNYDKMRAYLHKLADGRDLVKSWRKTDWSVLDINGIEVEGHSDRAGLQLADCVTSAFFNAVEVNRYGDTEQAYALKLKKNLLMKDGSSRNCGLTIVGKHKARATERHFFNACWE